MPTPAQRIEDLRRQIDRHNRLYYVQTTTEISDGEFDALLRELQDLEAQHPDLVTPDSPTQRVGGEPIEGFNTVAHARPMMSIDNTYDRVELRKWYDRTLKAIAKVQAPDSEVANGGLFPNQADPKIALVLEPKIDGVAVSLRYEQGKLVQALSRGDGKRGDDITLNVRTIRAVPLRLNPDVADRPSVLEVRGEIFMPDAEFQRINDDREEQGLERFANPRNATAGTLKSLDPSVADKRGLKFYAHGRGELNPDNFASYHTFLANIRTLGLPTNKHTTLVNTFDEAWAFIEAFQGKRATLGYATDGVVIKLDDHKLQEQLGATSKAPRWCIAYKYAAEQATTVLKEVVWQVGKTGKLTPRATMDPVFLAGTTVQHASLHNYGEVLRKDIRIGDTVVIEKAGEIIPQVKSVVIEKRPKNSKPIKPPDKCPSCRQPIVKLEDEAAHRCVNPECPAQFREKLIWFVGRNQMDIDGLGKKLIDQLIDNQLVAHYADLYHLREDILRELTRDTMMNIKQDDGTLKNELRPVKLGDRASVVVSGINKSKHAGLSKILAALDIRHIGAANARLIAQNFEDYNGLLKASEKTISDALSTRQNKSESNLEDFAKRLMLHLQDKHVLSLLRRHGKIALGDRLLSGPTLKGLTRNRVDKLADYFNNLENLVDADEVTIIVALRGQRIARTLYTWLHTDMGIRTIQSLRDAGLDLSSREYVIKDSLLSGPLTGKKIVITGSFTGFSRAELSKRLMSLGANVTSSVTQKTDILIAGEKPGSKLVKANILEVEVWDQKRLLSELGN